MLRVKRSGLKGNFRVVFFWLSWVMNNRLAAHLRAAEELYQQLVIETDQIDYRRQLAATLVELGLSMKFHGELQTAELTANRGIELLAPVLSESPRDVRA